MMYRHELKDLVGGLVEAGARALVGDIEAGNRALVSYV